MIKRIALGALGLLALCSGALAQVNTVPQVGLITSTLKQPTYTASAVGLVPAASGTDIFCISPGTSKNISIKKITIAGSAGTAITTPFLVYRRVTLDTGGTPATGIALPVAVPLFTSDPASTATLVSYTANPTITDASPKLLDAPVVSLAVTTTANNPPAATVYGEALGFFTHGLVLSKNTTQQVCINVNAVSIASGVVAITMIWTENP